METIVAYLRRAALSASCAQFRIFQGGESGCPIGYRLGPALLPFAASVGKHEPRNEPLLQSRNALKHRLRPNQIFLSIYADRISRRRGHIYVDAVIQQS